LYDQSNSILTADAFKPSVQSFLHSLSPIFFCIFNLTSYEELNKKPIEVMVWTVSNRQLDDVCQNFNIQFLKRSHTMRPQLKVQMPMAQNIGTTRCCRKLQKSVDRSFIVSRHSLFGEKNLLFILAYHLFYRCVVKISNLHQYLFERLIPPHRWLIDSDCFT
jgi:hypothetical protein